MEYPASSDPPPLKFAPPSNLSSSSSPFNFSQPVVHLPAHPVHQLRHPPYEEVGAHLCSLFFSYKFIYYVCVFIVMIFVIKYLRTCVIIQISLSLCISLYLAVDINDYVFLLKSVCVWADMLRFVVCVDGKQSNKGFK